MSVPFLIVRDVEKLVWDLLSFEDLVRLSGVNRYCYRVLRANELRGLHSVKGYILAHRLKNWHGKRKAIPSLMQNSSLRAFIWIDQQHTRRPLDTVLLQACIHSRLDIFTYYVQRHGSYLVNFSFYLDTVCQKQNRPLAAYLLSLHPTLQPSPESLIWLRKEKLVE